MGSPPLDGQRYRKNQGGYRWRKYKDRKTPKGKQYTTPAGNKAEEGRRLNC
jgi:hypothetical protein